MYVTFQKFVFDDIVYQMLLNQTLFLLTCIHQAFIKDSINAARNSCGFLINIIYGFISEYFLFSSA